VEAETRYHPNADQLALASTIEESLAPLLPLSRLHASHVEDAQTWSSLDDIGIFGITVAEEQGGSGLVAAEEALIVMALGQRLVAPAVIATIGAAHGLFGAAGAVYTPLGVAHASSGAAGTAHTALGAAHTSAPVAHASLSVVRTSLGAAVRAPLGAGQTSSGATHTSLDMGASGRRAAAAYRRGARTIVVEDAAADLVLLRDGAGAALYELGSCTSRPIDDRLWLAGLREVVGSGEARAAREVGAAREASAAGEAGAVPGLGEPIARFDAPQLLRLRLIDAAALAGISQAALDMSVAYAGTRAQFGRPIGSFQAVKHHCANMVSAARRARDQTCFAAVAIDEGRDDADLQVECALFVAASAALENAGKNIQIHGGMGFSDEADPHLLLKRAQLLTTIAGGLEAANERIANIKAGW
jgi:alkylation response protein AidB-like acyl-CoA dehydrogenase